MRPLVACLILMLFGMMTVRSHVDGVFIGRPSAWKKSAGDAVVLAALNESGVIKLAPTQKVLRSISLPGGRLRLARNLSGQTLTLSVNAVTGMPMLARSAWVGIIELRI